MAEMGRLTPPADSRRAPDRAREAPERFAAHLDFLRFAYARDCARGIEGPRSVRPSVRSGVRIRDLVPTFVVRRVGGRCMDARCRSMPAHPVHP